MCFLTLISNNAHWLVRISIVSLFLYHATLKFIDLNGLAELLPFSCSMLFMAALVQMLALAQVGGALLILLGGLEFQVALALIMAYYLMIVGCQQVSCTAAHYSAETGIPTTAFR